MADFSKNSEQVEGMHDYRLHVFRLVAEKLNFTQASRSLRISQPAVTQHIKLLEEYYGQPLFVRGVGAISLTPAGHALLEHTIKIEVMHAGLEKRLLAGLAVVGGPLKLAASTTIAQYLLPRWLGRFQQSYPQVELSLRMGNTEEVTGALLAKRVDLGLIEGPSNRRELKAVSFYEDEIVPVAAPNHPLAVSRKISVEQLQQAPCVLREQGSGTRRVVESALKRAKIDPKKLNVVMISDSSETIKGILETGMGVGFLSRLALRHELQRKTLQVLSVPGLKITRPLRILFPQGPEPLGPAGVFVDFLQDSALKET